MKRGFCIFILSTLALTMVAQGPYKVIVEDKSQYDQDFLERLTGFDREITLRGDYFLYGSDSVRFSLDLPLSNPLLFTGQDQGKQFELELRRQNLTTLLYVFTLKNVDNFIMQSKTGRANLLPSFFLAPEVEEDDQGGGAYFSYEYWDLTEGCKVSIRVGIGKDDKGKQRARITYFCDGKDKASIRLGECPTLRAN